MTIRIKTIEYSLQVLKTLTDNTLTPFQQKIMYISEFTGTVTFKSVFALVCVQEVSSHIIGNYITRQLNVGINGASAVTYTSGPDIYTNSGESICLFFGGDVTNNFIANWTSGTSATIDVSILVDNSSATTRLGNVSVIFYITYEYDDTQPYQIKTVYVPLACPVGALATTKPGACDTVPKLSTEFPEAHKIWRDLYVVVQGNYSNTNNTTDNYITTQLGALTVTGPMSSNKQEAGQASDYWHRHIFKLSSMATYNPSSSYTWHIWSNAARMNHQQAYLNATYEFNSTKSSGTYISVMLPMEVPSPMGGPSIGDFQRSERQFWIEEPDPISTKSVAYYAHWNQIAAIAGLNMRISGNNYGNPRWITYTDIAAVLAGSNGAMVKSGCGVTLRRGRNNLYYDVYRTDTTNLGWGIGGYWIVCYTAGKPTNGYGASNRTIKYHITGSFNGPSGVRLLTNSFAPSFSETDYYINAIGNQYMSVTSATQNLYSINVLYEKSGSENGVSWIPAYIDAIYTDAETGLRLYYSQIRDGFDRWVNDFDDDRLDIRNPRRWQIYNGNNIKSYHWLDLIWTMHNNTFSVAGSVSGYTGDGSGIQVNLVRCTDGQTKMSGATSAGGNYSFNWFDNTEPVYVEARQGPTLVGISPSGYAI